jgi:hypothetical protein
VFSGLGCGGGATGANGLLLKPLQPGADTVFGIKHGTTELRPWRAFALLSPDLKRAHALVKLRAKVGLGEVAGKNGHGCIPSR